MSRVPFFIARFVIRFRYPILILSIILLVLSGLEIRRDFRLAQNIKDDLPSDDPQIVTFENFLNQFGDAELLVIGVETDDVFTYEALTFVDRLTRQAEKIKDIDETLSLSNALEIIGSDGLIEVAPFFPESGLPKDPAGLSALKQKALSNKFWVNSLVSPKGDACAINMKLGLLQDDATFRFEVVNQVQKLLEDPKNAPPAGIKTRLTGVSVFGRDSIKAMEDDLVSYIWLMPVLVLVLLFAVFRTLRGVLVPQVVIWFAVAYTLAFLFVTGKAITMISTMLPVLIGVIAISDVIHVIARYYEESQTIRDKKALVQSTMEKMLPPCFLTSTTTAAGFGALMVSDLTQVRDFGLFAAIGLMLAFIVAMTVAPIILSFLPVPKTKIRESYQTGFFNRTLTAVNDFVYKDKILIPILTVVLVIVSIMGISYLRVETQLSKFLPQDAPSVVNLYWLQDKMAGVSTLEMTLRGEPGTFKEPWAVDELKRLQDYLESLPEVNKAFSLADFVLTFNRVLHDDDPAFYDTPKTRQAVAQYLLLFEMTGEKEMLDSFINADYSYTRVSARIVSMSSSGHNELIEHVNDYARRRIDSRLQFQTTGVVVLYATLTTALVNGQINSLFIAFFVITIMMIVHLRSLRLGLLSMVPNTLPIMVTLGMMGLFEITLNVATVMIACIALGIAVDDTIHYLSRYGSELRQGHKGHEAMRRTMLGAGRGMVFTSLVLTGGFMVLCFSSFHTNRAFGILIAITMVSAIFADLFLLPVLLRLFRLDR